MITRGKHLQSRSKILQRRLNTRRCQHLLAVSVPPGGLSRQWLAAKHQVPSVASHRTSNDVLKIERSHARHDLKIHAHHSHMFTCVPQHCTSVQWQTSWMHPWHHSNAKRQLLSVWRTEHVKMPISRWITNTAHSDSFNDSKAESTCQICLHFFDNCYGRSILIGATKAQGF